MTILRTPDECFEGIADFPFAPHYAEVYGYRVHYLDEGPPDGAPILLMHGEPSWCYLYRKMIPPLVEAGHRCIAPDLIGFGRSDKLPRREDYSYQFHVDVMNGFVRSLGLENLRLFGQDWGGLIGLRVLGGKSPSLPKAGGGEHRFADGRPQSVGRISPLAPLLPDGGKFSRRRHHKRRL
jgi:haloalkane dehalogenase